MRKHQETPNLLQIYSKTCWSLCFKNVNAKKKTSMLQKTKSEELFQIQGDGRHTGTGTK